VSQFSEQDVEELATLMKPPPSDLDSCACLGRPLGSTKCYCQIREESAAANRRHVARLILMAGYRKEITPADALAWNAHSGPRSTGWYYHTGQAKPVGPFATRAEAEQHAKDNAK